LVCDEAHLVLPQPLSPRGRELAVVTLVRNRQQTLYVVCQRPQLVSIVARQNAVHVCAFGADSARYLDPGLREYGDPASFAACAGLEPGRYVYRGPRYSPGERLEVRDGTSGELPW
jgi:hypothetical protein